jgi:RNA polymerase sigma-70 factor, ECF subfamily
MAAIHRAARGDQPGEALAPRLLFRTIVALVWKALERSRLSPADRDDIAQNVAIRAFLRRATYREERGNLEQWLSGIIRNEISRFLKAQSRQPLPAPGDEPLDAMSAAPTPEESVSLSDLADHVFAFVPPEERRVVILHDIEGHTLREVAALVGISPSTAHDRHQRGIALLRAAAEEEERRGVLPLPAALAALLGADRQTPGPSADLLERAWRGAARELGFDDPPESEPPRSGPRARGESAEASPASDVDHRPSTLPPSGPGSSLRRLFGPVAVALLGVLVAGSALDHCGEPPSSPGAERPAVASVAAPVPATGAAHLTPESRVATTSASPAAVLASASSMQAVRGIAPPSRDDAQLSDERALMDQARAALALERFPDAVKALSAHARRFPRGQNAVMREQMWAEACARHRRAHPRIDVPEMELRCAER